MISKPFVSLCCPGGLFCGQQGPYFSFVLQSSKCSSLLTERLKRIHVYSQQAYQLQNRESIDALLSPEVPINVQTLGMLVTRTERTEHLMTCIPARVFLHQPRAAQKWPPYGNAPRLVVGKLSFGAFLETSFHTSPDTQNKSMKKHMKGADVI